MAEASGKRITLGRLKGDCAKEFGDLLLQDMRAHGIATINDDPGAGVLPAAIISVEVKSCEAHELQPILGEGLPAMHISRTEGLFVATIHAVDPTDGKELASVSVRAQPHKDNESQTSSPEYPGPSELKSMAVRQGLLDARHLYTPWIENREIQFADNKDCNLKQAFDLAKSADYEALLRTSRANADSCQGKAALDAWYNLGVAAMLTGKYDDAVAAFEKATEMNGTKLVGGLIEESRKYAEEAKARQPKPVTPAPGEATQTGIVMTNEFVMRLVDANIAEDEIIKMVAAQPCRFSLAPDDLAKLKSGGVPDTIITAMRNKK